MHGGTQTIRFFVHWGVKAHVAGSCGESCGLADDAEVAIQAVDWFVPEHHLSMYWFKVSFLRGKVQKGWEN